MLTPAVDLGCVKTLTQLTSRTSHIAMQHLLQRMGATSDNLVSAQIGVGRLRRRDFIAFFGGAAVGWPLPGRTQPRVIPVTGYLGQGSPEADADGFDPVQAGLAASLSGPGGNLTGSNVYGGELGAKGLEVLHELLPATTSGSPALTGD
jgi:hypothetical protein